MTSKQERERNKKKEEEERKNNLRKKKKKEETNITTSGQQTVSSVCVICLLMASLRLGHVQHAAQLAASASKEDTVAKEIYRSLRVASGIFEHLEKNEIAKVRKEDGAQNHHRGAPRVLIFFFFLLALCAGAV